MKKFGRAGSTFGTVIAAAVVIAVASTGGAVAGGLITSKQIKNNTIKSIDVRDGNLKGIDVADGSLSGADLADGSVTSADVADNSLTTSDVANGSLTHSDFTSSPIGVVQGYAWINDGATTIGTPVQLTNSYVYNSAGGAVSVTRTGTGLYSVNFAGLDFFPGNVQVTSYGASVTSCKVGSWGTSTANIRCYDLATAALADTSFSLAVIK